MNNRQSDLLIIEKEFLKNLESNFPDNAFNNSDLLVKSFKGDQSLYNKGEQIPPNDINAATLREILTAVEQSDINDKEAKHYDEERFKNTLKDLGISDKKMAAFKLDTVDILKAEAILFNILTPVYARITATYMNEEGKIDEIAATEATDSFKKAISNHVLERIYEAKIFSLQATKEIDQLMAQVKAISEVINPPDNAYFLQRLDALKDLRENILNVDSVGMQAIIETHKSGFYGSLHKFLDKITIPYQAQIDEKTNLLVNHYIVLAENENSSAPNIARIKAIKSDIKKMEEEIITLNSKTTQIMNVLSTGMGEKYNPYLDKLPLDEISLPVQYQEIDMKTTTLPIYREKYAAELKNITNENNRYESLKDQFIENNALQKQLANNFLNRSVNYTDKNASINGALATVYFNAIELYRKKYPRDDLQEKFGNTFKQIFNSDLNKILQDDAERSMLISKYQTRQFIELFNQTFDLLSNKQLGFNVLGYNDSYLYAQEVLSTELNKMKKEVNSLSAGSTFNLDIIHVDGNHIAPDYKKLVIVEEKKVIDPNAYVKNLDQAQRELELAHQKTTTTFLFAKNAKNSLIDAVERDQQKNLAKKDKKNQTELQSQQVKWKTEEKVLNSLTTELQTIKLDDATEDEFTKRDDMFRQFRIFLNNIREQIKNEILNTGKSQLKPLEHLIEFLGEVRDKNQAKSQRVALDTIYVELNNNEGFRAVLENEFIKKEINKFIEMTDHFTKLPQVEVRSIKKAKGKKEKPLIIDESLYTYPKENINTNANANVSTETSFKTNPLHQPKTAISQENPIYQDEIKQPDIKPEGQARPDGKANQVTNAEDMLLQKIVTQLQEKKNRNLLAKVDPFDLHFKKVQSINILLKSLEPSLRNKRSYEDAMKEIFKNKDLLKAYNTIMKQNTVISFFSKNKDSLTKVSIDNLVKENKRKSLDQLQKETLKDMPKLEAPKRSLFGRKST